MENQHLVSPSRQCSSTPGGFVKEFVIKEQFDNTGASSTFSWTGFSRFLSVPSTEINSEGIELLFFLVLITSFRMRRKSWKGFHKTAHRNFSSTFTVAGQKCIFWRKCGLHDCTISNFSEMKCFRENFVATAYFKHANTFCALTQGVLHVTVDGIYIYT